jgi:hypothetical protein
MPTNHPANLRGDHYTVADEIMAEFGPTGRYLTNPSKPKHVCTLPAEWPTGAVWRCVSGHLWVVGPACLCRDRLPHDGQHTLGRAWWPAGWWTRQLWNLAGHMTKRARLEQASQNRVQYAPKAKGSPPKSQSGVSPSRDGSR